MGDGGERRNGDARRHCWPPAGSGVDTRAARPTGTRMSLDTAKALAHAARITQDRKQKFWRAERRAGT